MAGKDDALTEQLNIRVSEKDLDELERLAIPDVVAPGTVARVALRLGIERLKADPKLLVESQRKKKRAE